MVLTISNLTGSTKSYLSGAISVAGNSSTTVLDRTQQLALSTDGQLKFDLLDAFVQLSDGVNTYGTIDAIDYLNLIPRNIGPMSDYLGNGITSEPYGSMSRSLNVMIGDGYQRDAFGRLRVSDTDLVESLHFSNTDHSLLMAKSVTGSATAAYNSASSSVRLTTTTSSSDSVIYQTRRYFRYNPGRSYLITVSGNIGAKKANVRKRLGYFDANNGLFFEQTSTDLSVGVRTNASGSPVDTKVTQSNWNIDKLDGTGVSGFNLDPSKHNLYVIDFLWHGAGRIRFGVLHRGQILYCHEVQGDNVNSGPFMRTPCLPLRMELTNTGTVASSTSMDLVCFAYQKESSDHLVSPYVFTASTARTATNVSSVLIPVLAIRPKATFQGNTNRIPIVPNSVSVAAGAQLTYCAVILNPTTLTGASFNSVNSFSAVDYDLAATAFTGGTIIHDFYTPASSSSTATQAETISSSLELLTLGLDIAGSTQDVLLLACQSTAGGTNTWAQIDWEEFQ